MADKEDNSKHLFRETKDLCDRFQAITTYICHHAPDQYEAWLETLQAFGDQLEDYEEVCQTYDGEE